MQFNKYRLIRFILEKCDSDQIISSDDQKICDETILEFTKMYRFVRHQVWGMLFDETWDDTVGVALLSRSTGYATIDLVNCMKGRFEIFRSDTRNKRTFELSRASIAVLLDKLGEEGHRSDFTMDVVSLLDATLEYLNALLDEGRTCAAVI